MAYLRLTQAWRQLSQCPGLQEPTGSGEMVAVAATVYQRGPGAVGCSCLQPPLQQLQLLLRSKRVPIVAPCASHGVASVSAYSGVGQRHRTRCLLLRSRGVTCSYGARGAVAAQSPSWNCALPQFKRNANRWHSSNRSRRAANHWSRSLCGQSEVALATLVCVSGSDPTAGQPLRL